MNKIIIIIFTLISIVIYSCSTDLDINAEWNDIPIVFCVLDQSQEYQYVKVNKSFLGDLPASVMAQQSDSLFYDNVQVLLFEYDQSLSLLNTIEFQETDSIEKEEGYFADDRNIIYFTDYQLDEDYLYQLEVNIDNDRKIVKSEITELISGAYISNPGPNVPFQELIVYDNPMNYVYYSGVNAKVAQVKIFFNYLEVIGEDTTLHSIEWPQPIDIIGDPSRSNEQRKSYQVMSFYSLLVNNIPEADDNVERLVKMPNSYEYRLSIANEDYRTYMEVSAPSHGIVQEKPSFSNLENAMGLFAARNNTNRVIRLGSRTVDSISRGIHTKHLGFKGWASNYYQDQGNW